jgi:hypothetical protein
MPRLKALFMRPARPLWALLALLFLTTWALPGHAQWTWRDKDGRITASNLPPPKDVADKDILSRPKVEPKRGATAAAAAASAASAPGSTALAGKAPLDRELDARKAAAEREQAAKTKADEERLAGQRTENCRRARAQQASLDSGQRIARVNAKGEREILDESALNEERRRAREVISSDCR